MKNNKHDDSERRLWVLNDEGLYQRQQASGMTLRAWVAQNRAAVDKVIDNVASGRRRQHYLAYGG